MTEARTQGTRSRAFRINLWLHRWCSLIATPFFLVLCLSGTVLIFHDEIDAALGYVPDVALRAGESPKPLAELASAAQKEKPGARLMSLYIDPEKPTRAFINLAPPDAHRLADGKASVIDVYTAKPLSAIDTEKTPTGFLLELHAEWFLGTFGQLFGGVIALLVLVSLISGVVVYAPYVRRIAFGVVRRGRGARRLAQLDLHNLIGVVVLGWILAVAFTGVLLALGGVAFSLWQSTELKQMAASAPQPNSEPLPSLAALPVNVDRAVAAARAARPDRVPSFVVWPGTDFSSPRHYAILLAGTHAYDKRVYEIALVDAVSGELAAVRPLPWYLQLIQVSEPLHFGDYGGLSLKLLWTACTWLTLFITGNGAWLWWARRRTHRRNSPRAEQIV